MSGGLGKCLGELLVNVVGRAILTGAVIVIDKQIVQRRDVVIRDGAASSRTGLVCPNGCASSLRIIRGCRTRIYGPPGHWASRLLVQAALPALFGSRRPLSSSPLVIPSRHPLSPSILGPTLDLTTQILTRNNTTFQMDSQLKVCK